MSAQRYERVSAHDDDELEHSLSHRSSSPSQNRPQQIPNSPPPSFRSRASSFAQNRSSSDRQHLISDADRTLADTFDAPSDDDSDDESARRLDDRQRVMSGRPADAEEEGETVESASGRPRPIERTVTQLPVFSSTNSGPRTYGGGNSVHDGVFANLSAKPERGEEVDEKPPSYEQAAADATPPYWETTILAPGGTSSDEVFIDGLPVGSLFSFVWNGMISMSFQLVGFLLTYLLHTTHAAKNGSKAGLGITLVQYGFTMKGTSSQSNGNGGSAQPGGNRTPGNGGPGEFITPPANPNGHDFDPNAIGGGGGAAFTADGGSMASATGSHGSAGLGSMTATDWFAYALMIIGWFVLIRAISEYLKARRHEALVLQSPSRGLPAAIVAEGERPEASV